MRILGHILIASVCLAAVGCTTDEPTTDDLYNRVERFVVSPGGAVTPADFEARVVAFVDGASTTLEVAFEDFASTTVADAIVAAQNRGVDVIAVGDIDRADQPGFARLVEGGVDVVFGDGENFWAPQPTVSVVRDGDHNRMTHNVLVADRRRVLVTTGGLYPADEPRTQIGFEAVSEDLAKDYGDVIEQMHGGVFATTLNLYGSMMSADTNNRTQYLTDDAWVLEAYFGPQEPLIKEVVDQVYAARSSVYVAAEALTNLSLANALRYKAEAGFDVRVVVDSAGVDEPYSRVELLDEWFADIREREGTEFPAITTADGVGANVVVVDATVSPVDGVRRAGRAMVLSAALHSGIAFVQEPNETISRTSDIFTDSNMWVVREQADADDAFVVQLRDLVLEAF